METTLPQIAETCFGLVWQASVQRRAGRLDQARGFFAAALVEGRALPAEFLPDFRAALACATLLMRYREDPGSVTPALRASAAGLLEQSKACHGSPLVQAMMYELLTELGEFQRAIPFAERALAISIETKGPATAADWMWKMGTCYSRIGMRDHAEISYRASAKIFRGEAGDPRLPVVLLALGNSIRKISPAEAESLYKEAAALWEQKGQLESATPAWSNLGIVCSDQGRFDEALAYYERVRQVRESTATPIGRLGGLYNNLASCQRKMKRFADAHHYADRAIAALEKAGPDSASTYASSIGTKGMILADEGRDAEAIEWFRRARGVFESQPAPNRESIIEELEHEAASLKRLGRDEQAQAAQSRIAGERAALDAAAPLRDPSEAPLNLGQGAVLIELNRGIRSDPREEMVACGVRLNQLLEPDNLGKWHGMIRIPEATTLIFYGPDPEAMFGAIEAELRTNAAFEGARVIVRRSAESREVIVPPRRVN